MCVGLPHQQNGASKKNRSSVALCAGMVTRWDRCLPVFTDFTFDNLGVPKSQDHKPFLLQRMRTIRGLRVKQSLATRRSTASSR